MTSTKRIAITASIVVLITAALIAAPTLYQKWHTPLGEGIHLPTPSITPRTSPTPRAIADANEAVDLTPAPTTTPEPLCGGREVMYLLGIGADSRSDNYLYGLADVIRVARVDFVTPRITVLSIPRDLWVEIPAIEHNYGITHGKLNQAYLYGGPGMGYYDGPGGAAGLLARTLYQNFDLRVDHYGGVNMITFERIIDALGGIDVYLEEPVDGRPIDDRTEDMGYFAAGHHHLNGDAALRLSRVRKKYSVFKRADNQTLVMCAMRDKLLTPQVLPKIPQLVAAFKDSVQTDLSPAEISQLLCLLPRVSKENLLFASFPEELFEAGRAYDPVYKIHTFVWDVDYDILRQMVTDFKEGIWPNEPKEATCP